MLKDANTGSGLKETSRMDKAAVLVATTMTVLQARRELHACEGAVVAPRLGLQTQMSRSKGEHAESGPSVIRLGVDDCAPVNAMTASGTGKSLHQSRKGGVE